MRQIHQITSRFLSSKATIFLKKSFCFALLYSTLLYLFVRIFFNDFPITLSEGFELFSKMLLVVWTFMITCKLVISGIILAENNLNKINLSRLLYVTVLIKSILILFPASQATPAKPGSADENKQLNTANNPGDEPAASHGMVQ